MSLYYVQKFLYELNRDEKAQQAYLADRVGVLDGYDLTDEEIRALVEPDIGLLFHLGVNGQILMHFAAFHQIAWADYLAAACARASPTHGPVREGVYAMTGYEGVDAHTSALGQRGRAAQGVGDEGSRMMPLVFAGVCSHAPGIRSRYEQADPTLREALYVAFDEMREALEATRPDAIVVVAAEHFANFFMNNMPSFAIGMADFYDGPIEDPDWLKIDKVRVPGNRELSHRFITEVMKGSDVAYAEEWRFDHGIMLPLQLPHAALRPSRDPGQHQLPGPAARAAAPGVDVRRVDPSRRRCAPGADRDRSARAASRTGRPRPTRARSTRRGTATSSTGGCATTARHCSPTTTSPSTPTPARAASRSARSSP